MISFQGSAALLCAGAILTVAMIRQLIVHRHKVDWTMGALARIGLLLVFGSGLMTAGATREPRWLIVALGCTLLMGFIALPGFFLAQWRASSSSGKTVTRDEEIREQE